MKEDLLCMNSDSVNRYRFRIHVSALEKSLKEVFDSGMPLLIGHDFHRPVGWTFPFGIYIEAGLARMLARRLIATNVDEMGYFQKGVAKYLSNMYQEYFTKYETQFLPIIKKYLHPEHTKIDAGCCAVIQKNIASEIFPSVFELSNDDGLIPITTILNDFTYLSQGIFQHKTSGLSIYAHSYFRRSQSRLNNYRFFFLDALVALSNNKQVRVQIRIDKDMIGYGPSFHETGELEYHWGPKFSDQIDEIKSGICRHECIEAERRFTGIACTEFYWKRDSGQMTFEAEELTDNPSPVSDEAFHCRYVHSIYDVKVKEFIHFDGAIRTYNFESMVERVGKSFLEYGRKALYKKLFRIDGKIPLDTWKLLITHYYQGNPLIYEYFNLKEQRDSQRVIESPITRFQQLIPFDIKKEEGLKLLVSYHTIPKDIRTGRYVDALDVMNSEEGKIYCLEQFIYEVKKALQEMGEDLEIPQNIKLLKFDDRYWNIPSIVHFGTDAKERLQATVHALIGLFSDMISSGMDKDVSLTLAFELNGRLIRISSYGHMENQINWLRDNFPFDHTETGFTNWVGSQREYLDQYKPNSETPIVGALTQTDGVLFIKRLPVEFPYMLDEADTGIAFKIEFPNDDEVLDLFNKGLVKPVLCIGVKRAVWSDTGEDYFTSSRSKRREMNIPVNISDWEPLALYWTKGC